MEQQQSQTPNVDKLPLEVKQQAVEAGRAARPSEQLMDRATSHQAQRTDHASGQSDTRCALMNTQGAPGQSQEALSPTDSHKGQTQSQQRSQSRGRGMERESWAGQRTCPKQCRRSRARGALNPTAHKRSFRNGNRITRWRKFGMKPDASLSQLAP